MRTLLIALCLLVVVYCQTQHKNGNPTGEIGQPAFDEIVVESTLTVRGKSGSRSGKSLVTNSKPIETAKDSEGTVDGASVTLKRNKRGVKRRPIGNRFPNSSSSAAQASSNAFYRKTPFGSFGTSASQSSSQSHTIGLGDFQGSAGHSASQIHCLPNGSKINLGYSNSFGINNTKPSSASSHSFTIRRADGKVETN